MSDLDSIRAISIDLDDTLWECRPVIKRAEALLYAWLQQHYPRITECYDIDQMREVRIRLSREMPHLKHDLTEQRKVSLRWHADKSDYHAETLAEDGFEIFIAARNEVTLFDDVLPMLERLSQRFPLIALTNGNADVRRVGIDHFFRHAISAADVTLGKPDPEMFHVACARLGIEPQRLLHLGDDPVHDVLGAQNVGARSVWVNRFGKEWPEDMTPADYQLGSLVGLEGLLNL